MYADTEELWDEWVDTIDFLKDICEKVQGSLTGERLASESSFFGSDGNTANSSVASERPEVKESWKLENLNKESMLSAVDDDEDDQ